MTTGEFFTSRDRATFRYHDGQRELFADPLALRRGLLLASGGSILELARAASGPAVPEGGPAAPMTSEQVLEMEAASEKLSGAVRAAFALSPFDAATGTGCTEAQVQRVWSYYCAFLAEQAQAGKEAS